MKKSKDPLSYHWERLNTKEDGIIGYYMGESPLEGKVIKMIKDISYRLSVDFTPLDHGWFWTAVGDGSKKTLNVTKKEDIKFVND